jgi:hypothetical protein
VKRHREKFGRKQEAAIIGLLTMPTIDEAAKRAGISGPTLWRWLQEPNFQAEHRKARRRALDQATAQLQQASGAAVKALVEIIEDTKAPSSSRVMAARAVLEMGSKALELGELEARVESLERAAEQHVGNTAGPIRVIR